MVSLLTTCQNVQLNWFENAVCSSSHMSIKILVWCWWSTIKMSMDANLVNSLLLILSFCVDMKWNAHMQDVSETYFSPTFLNRSGPKWGGQALEVDRKLREGTLQGTSRKWGQASGEDQKMEGGGVNKKKPKTKQNKGVLVSNNTFIDLNLVDYYFFCHKWGGWGVQIHRFTPPRVISPLNLKFIQSNTKRSENNSAFCSFHVHCSYMYKVNPNNLIIYII